MQKLIAEKISAKYDVEDNTDFITLRINKDDLLHVMKILKHEKEFSFNQLTDLCAIDYSMYGKTEWKTKEATNTGYSRGIKPLSHGRIKFEDDNSSTIESKNRFCISYHLLSLVHNERIRIKVYLSSNPPIIPSITSLWPAADWYEREAFDLFGILFDGHPDLRRILTDYGFIGYPFRKDFPLVGNIQIRYDSNIKRIIQEPVDISPRVLVPKVIRGKNK
tara:strand:- start:683 stop:1342 length:660 start_codon:yes stop_codon:yes gene_type:complete